MSTCIAPGCGKEIRVKRVRRCRVQKCCSRTCAASVATKTAAQLRRAAGTGEDIPDDFEPIPRPEQTPCRQHERGTCDSCGAPNVWLYSLLDGQRRLCGRCIQLTARPKHDTSTPKAVDGSARERIGAR